jgi:hypothetical protein
LWKIWLQTRRSVLERRTHANSRQIRGVRKESSARGHHFS